MKNLRKIGAAMLATAAMLPALLASGCGAFDPDEVHDIKMPPYDDANFRLVSAVLERRCGTIDCHGAPARPLRIYGQYGLRRYEPLNSPNLGEGEDIYQEYYSGGTVPTTGAELSDNYGSVCGLEPELMGRVFAQEDDPLVLTLVRKARLREKHKGGLLWNKGESGDVCLTNWLTGNTNTAPCEIELGHP